MKTFLKKKTYKRQMFLFSLVTISIIILILGVYTGVNRSLIRQYNESYALYQYLNDFFDTQSFAHDSLKNYLYTKSEKECDNFKRAFHQAKEDIQILNDSAQKNAGIWRFTLLDNMMDSYLEQANQVILLMKIQDHKYNEGYEKLLKINETIIQSSDDYYQLVTNVVDKILEKIEVTKQETDVFSWCIVAFSVIGLSIYTIIVLRSITNPIDKLVDNLHEIRAGTFDFHKIPASSEEIQVLCFALQDLSDTISRNIEYEKEKAELKNQLLIKENENLRKDELLVSSELKILQNQINPNFFFNTVNMIYQQAILEKADITVEMIEKMTECMRYTLSQNTRISNLAMELKDYVALLSEKIDGISYDNPTQDEATYIRYEVKHVIHAIIKSRSKSMNKIVLDAYTYIGKNYHRSIGLNDLANYLDLTPQYISSLLSQHTKNSFTNILAEYRVEKAKQLLLNNRKIKEVSSLVGFQNQNYFAKTFKKVTGYTPKEYKQMHVMNDI